jgi:phage terminase large subunit-like protein
MLQNVVLDENKRGGLIPAKISRSEKIDGIDATIYGWNQSLDPENRKLYAGTYSQYFFLEGKTK